MGVQDIVTKDYMKNEQRFADAFNYYLFQGNQIVQAEKLKEADPVEFGIILDGQDNEAVQKIRDVLKNALFLTDETCNYLSGQIDLLKMQQREVELLCETDKIPEKTAILPPGIQNALTVLSKSR